jgi:hypothetical protein
MNLQIYSKILIITWKYMDNHGTHLP